MSLMLNGVEAFNDFWVKDTLIVTTLYKDYSGSVASSVTEKMASIVNTSCAQKLVTTTAISFNVTIYGDELKL